MLSYIQTVDTHTGFLSVVWFPPANPKQLNQFLHFVSSHNNSAQLNSKKYFIYPKEKWKSRYRCWCCGQEVSPVATNFLFLAPQDRTAAAPAPWFQLFWYPSSHQGTERAAAVCVCVSVCELMGEMSRRGEDGTRSSCHHKFSKFPVIGNLHVELWFCVLHTKKKF